MMAAIRASLIPKSPARTLCGFWPSHATCSFARENSRCRQARALLVIAALFRRSHILSEWVGAARGAFPSRRGTPGEALLSAEPRREGPNGDAPALPTPE